MVIGTVGTGQLVDFSSSHPSQKIFFCIENFGAALLTSRIIEPRAKENVTSIRTAGAYRE